MKHVSLKKRLMAGAVVTCVLITLCVSFYQIGRLQAREQELLHREIANFEHSAMASIREAVWNYDWSMVETVAASQINSLLTYVEICDAEREQCIEVGEKGLSPQQEHFLKIDYQTSPQVGRVEIGSAYLQLHCQPFSELFNRYILTEFIANGLGVSAVAVAIFLLFHLTAIRRIVAISQYARDIDLTAVESMPPLSLGPQGATLDDVDVLEESINGLVARIKEEFSRRKQLEIQLNHAQKMEALGTLAGGIAHDFNNILTAMLGYVQLCYNSAEAGSKTQRRLEQVLLAGDRATALISQIMIFSRKSETHTQSVCLAEIVTETFDLVRASWPENIAHEMELNEDLWILGDAGQIHQVLLNLATNSGQALQEAGGQITVALTEKKLTTQEAKILNVDPGTYACLRFCDNGPGIPEEVRSRVFDPFFTTKETGKGTGMGLAVVHGIVHAHGGKIVLEPAADRGCCFTLYFPLAEAGKKRDGAQSYDISTALCGSEHLLLVDDDPVVIGMGQEMLRSLGYRVTTCGKPTEALNVLLERDDIDLLMTDLTMPEMSGIELAVALRRQKDHIPIVLYTGNVDNLDQSVLGAGTVDQLLEKPFTVKDLSQVIRRALEGD